MSDRYYRIMVVEDDDKLAAILWKSSSDLVTTWCERSILSG